MPTVVGAFFLFGFGEPSCLFAEVGYGFSIHFLLTVDCRLKPVP